MKSLFSGKNMLLTLGYALNFFLFLLIFAYFSLNHDWLHRGSLALSDSFYLSLPGIYWSVILVSWLYYSLYTTDFTRILSIYRQPQRKYKYYQHIDWSLDAALIYTFMAFSLVMNYIAYYPKPLTAYQTARDLIMNNPVFYWSLGGYLVLNYGIYIFYQNRIKSANRKEL